MSLFEAYLDEIETRKREGLNPKPIEDAELTREIIWQIIAIVNLSSQLCKVRKPIVPISWDWIY